MSEEEAVMNPNNNEEQEKTLKVFLCCAREDEELCCSLEKHLTILQRKGMIQVWHDRQISAGREWEYEVVAHLNAAHMILLLVSPDFLASDSCYRNMQRAMDRHQRGQAQVIPIILRPVHFQDTPFATLPVLPTGAIPVTSGTWANLDEAFYHVVKGLRPALGHKRSFFFQKNMFQVLSRSQTKPLGFSLKRRTVLVTLMLICTTLLVLSASLWQVLLKDANLEVSAVDEQSSAQVLSSNIHAQRLDDPKARTPYHITFQVHNLRQDAFLYLEDIHPVIDKVTATPQPLNVWMPTDITGYGENYYRAVYLGQQPGQLLGAVSIPSSAVTPVLVALPAFGPRSHIELRPGESDKVNIVIYAYQPVPLQFHVQMTYYVDKEVEKHVSPFLFSYEVIFSHGENWHTYTRSGGISIKSP